MMRQTQRKSKGTKKPLARILAAALAAASLTGCNKQLTDVDYSFDKVHLRSIGACLAISSWDDRPGNGMIKVTLEDTSAVMAVSSVEATLVRGTCPYCGAA